jgi:hypothetical protein
MRAHRRCFRAVAILCPILGALAGLTPLPASSDPVPGFHEEWHGTSLGDWGGGSLFDNPGTGGVDGDGDGYLRFWTITPYNLGVVSLAPQYGGNWIAAGITTVKVSINDVGAPDPLEIHFIIGNQYNVWEYNVGFFPPNNQWKEFTVDLTDGNYKRIIGTGTFEQCLSAVDRIHFRHDHAPFIHPPDPIQADCGIDHLVLLSSSTPTVATTWGRIKRLYR